MKKSSRNSGWRLVASLFIITMLLAACGGNQPTSPATPPATLPAASPAITQAAPPATAQVTTPVTVPATAPATVPATVAATVPATQPAVTSAPTGGPKLNPDVSGEVEMWHFWASPVRRNAIRHVIGMCESKLPNIKVTDTVKPFGDIWTANIAAVAAGSGMPDIIVSDRPTLPKDAAQGIYMDLQEWADRDGVTRDQFYDWSWDQTLYQGHTYGIPHETDVRVLFWNKQLFEKAGLDPNKPPETWSELQQYADKLDVKDSNGKYTRIAFMPLWNAGFDIWTYSNNAALIAPDGTPQINNPNAVETMKWIKSWIDRYGGWQAVQDFQAQFGAPPNDIFMSNGVAMLVDIFGYNSFLTFYGPRSDVNDPIGTLDGKDPRMEWGIGLMPHGDNADFGDWSGGFSMSIPTGAKNPEAAWEMIKCITGVDGQTIWALDTQAQPTNIKATQNEVLTSNPLWGVVDKALSVSTGGVYVEKYPNWSEQLQQRYEAVWKGDLSPEDALNQAQEAVQAELNK